MAKKILQTYNFVGNQILDFRVENLAAFPVAGKAGRIVLNTTTSHFAYDNGAKFVELAALDSPAFSGIPTAPTAAIGTNSDQIATTAYVSKAVSDASVADGTLNNAKFEHVKPGTIKGRRKFDSNTAAALSAGPVEDITFDEFIANLKLGTLAFKNAVGGSDYQDASIQNAKLAEMPAKTLKGNASGASAGPQDLSTTQVKALLNIGVTDIQDLANILTGKASTSHTHSAADIADLKTTISNEIVAYWDSIAGSNGQVDTIREVLDLVLSNSADLASQVRRYAATIGDGVKTSIPVAHNLNSNDVTVEVYDVGTGETVGVGVTRTSANMVLIEAMPAPQTNSLRVVVKY